MDTPNWASESQPWDSGCKCWFRDALFLLSLLIWWQLHVGPFSGDSLPENEAKQDLETWLRDRILTAPSRPLDVTKSEHNAIQHSRLYKLINSFPPRPE